MIGGDPYIFASRKKRNLKHNRQLAGYIVYDRFLDLWLKRTFR